MQNIDGTMNLFIFLKYTIFKKNNTIK